MNAGGFVLLGAFTSHVTGNVAMFPIGVATHDSALAGTAIGLVLSFLIGSFSGALVIDDSVARGARSYGFAFLLEAGLLVLVIAESTMSNSAQAFVLSAAMGLQNGLVTRLSGAVVRTTHLTGVVTDVGIELATWLRQRLYALRARSVPQRHEQVFASKMALLLSIAGGFVLGATLGGITCFRHGHIAMVIPVSMLSGVALYAFMSRASVNAS